MSYLMTEYSANDPYDLWATPQGIKAKRDFIHGSLGGKLRVALLALADWFSPHLSRSIIKAMPVMTPILVAHQIMRHLVGTAPVSDSLAVEWLEKLVNCSVQGKQNKNDAYSWGLGFAWMDRRGFYDVSVPFITHTPYVMEALLEIAQRIPSSYEQAMRMFHGTWDFLESLHTMYQDEHLLALSYSPLASEGLIVVNASAYAGFAYALHAVHGTSDCKLLATQKAIMLAKWVLSQQQESGAWTYLAGNPEGNFIDCFHSCFVIKNLRRINKLLPDSGLSLTVTIERGMKFLENNFIDETTGLCKRFVYNKRNFRDPYKWELYDQAEFLGLLVDSGRLSEASTFSSVVEKFFCKSGSWYCRVDFLGRAWGKNFLRWGIVPYLYQKARLEQALQNGAR